MKTSFFSVLVLILISFDANGQIISPTYKPFVKNITGASGTAASDGNLFLYGGFDAYGNDIHGKLIKVDPTGALVPGFAKTPYSGEVRNVHELPSGKLLVLRGYEIDYAEEETTELIRLNSDGSIDDSFQADISLTIKGFVVQSNGKIVVVLYGEPGDANHSMIRLNENGDPDETFDGWSGWMVHFQGMAIDSKDQIYLMSFSTLSRFTKDGAIDEEFSFEVSDPEDEILSALAVNHEDKPLLSIRDHAYESGTGAAVVIRLTEDGSIDQAFGTAEADADILCIVVRSDGNILLGGAYSTYDGENATGRLIEVDEHGDFVRMAGKSVATSRSRSLLEDIHGNVYVNASLGFQKLNTDGSVNEDFSLPVFSTGGDFTVLGLQSGGRLLVAGKYSEYVGVGDDRSKLVRLNADGSLDETFNVPDRFRFSDHQEVVTALAVQEDDKIIVGTIAATPGAESIWRFLPDGDLDETFMIGSGTTNSTGAFISQIVCHNQKIYITGAFDSFDGHEANGFAILDKEGNWTGPTETSEIRWDRVSDIEFQSDGKMLAFINEYAPPIGYPIYRLSEDGVVDENFLIGAVGYVQDMAIDEADSIWLVGVFIDNETKYIQKYDKDGTFDSSVDFADDFGNNQILLAKALPGNRMMLSGPFDSYKGAPVGGVVVIKSNGKRVPFVTPFEKNSYINRMMLADEVLYLHGQFYEDGAAVVSSIRRVLFEVETNIDTLISMPVTGTQARLSWEGDFIRADSIKVEVSKGDNSSYEVYENLSVGAHSIDVNGLEAEAIYYFRIRGENEVYASRNIETTNDPNAITGLAEKPLAVSFYPNPFVDRIMINNPGDVKSVVLYSSTGMVLMNASSTELDTSALPPGLYILKIGNTPFKVVKR